MKWEERRFNRDSFHYCRVCEEQSSLFFLIAFVFIFRCGNCNLSWLKDKMMFKSRSKWLLMFFFTLILRYQLKVIFFSLNILFCLLLFMADCEGWRRTCEALCHQFIYYLHEIQRSNQREVFIVRLQRSRRLRRLTFHMFIASQNKVEKSSRRIEFS